MTELVDGITVVVPAPDLPVVVPLPAPVAPAVGAAPPDPPEMAVLPVPGPPGAPGKDADLSPGDLARVIAAATDATSAELRGHVADLSPHPAYDDLPSLRLIFENGLI